MKDLQQRIEELQAENADLRKQVKDLTDETWQLGSRIEELELENTDLYHDNEYLQGELEELRGDK